MQLDKLPEGWAETEIREVADIVTGSTPPTSDPDNYGGDIPFVKPGDLDVGEPIRATESTVTEKGAERGRRLPAGAVLVSCIGNLGKVGVLERPGLTNQQINAVVPYAGIDPDFVLAWARIIKPWMEANASATTVTIINKGRFQRAPFLFPPLAEQRRIVAKLDALEERRRAVKAKLDRLPDLLDRYRQSVLAAAFRGDLTTGWRERHPDTEPADVLLERIRAEHRRRWIEHKAQTMTDRAEARAAKKGQTWDDEMRAARLEKERKKAVKKYEPPAPVDKEDLPELPQGWCWTTLAEATVGDTDYRGKTPKKSAEGTIPLISSAAVKGGHIVDGPSGYITEETYEKILVRGVPEPGDIIVTTEAPVGEAALFPSDGTYMLSRRVIAFSAYEALPTFLMNAISTQQATKHIRKWGRGSTVPRILKPHLQTLPIPLAPAEEQVEIVSLLSQALSRIRNLQEAIVAKMEDIDTLQQATLARAFRGELVPTEAALARREGRDYEDAESLLARVRAERNGGASSKKERTGTPKSAPSAGDGHDASPADLAVDADGQRRLDL